MDVETRQMKVKRLATGFESKNAMGTKVASSQVVSALSEAVGGSANR